MGVIVLIPDHCLSIYFVPEAKHLQIKFVKILQEPASLSETSKGKMDEHILTYNKITVISQISNSFQTGGNSVTFTELNKLDTPET